MIYETIQNIAKNILIRKIESDISLSNRSIRKWEDSQTTSLSMITAVANYLKGDLYTLSLVGIDMNNEQY